MHVLGSSWLVLAFLTLALVLSALFLGAWRLGVRRGLLEPASFRCATAGTCGWLVGWGALSLFGFFDAPDGVPPRPLFMILPLFLVTVWLGFSIWGKQLARALSFRWLVGFQMFRLPLELLMYRAMLEGLMPPQMSFAGYNYDIVTGITAGALALLGTAIVIPRWLLWCFNLMGSTLLLVVLVVALASMPTFAVFGPDRLNTWVFGFPYVYLPAVMVQAALLGHLLMYRKLRQSEPGAAARSTRTPSASTRGLA